MGFDCYDRTVKPVVRRDKNHVQGQSRGMFNVLNNVDRVSSNVQFSHQEALLYVFEDNEAVIKMIIKGRSPTMRHVSRTHRVALAWLFDRINLDPKIQIKYIDTNLLISEPKEISHVTSGINCCSCSISAISVPGDLISAKTE